MAMNVTEANAAAVVLHCILHGMPEPEKAKEAAKVLAEGANKRLLAGPTPTKVEEYWPSTEERPDASALLYVGDDDGCEACEWIEEHRPDAWGYDWCPFHAGMEEGRAWFARAIAAMNNNPDLANGVLVDHERNQQQEADGEPVKVREL
mgnify:FL=1